ncbi:MAG: N-6 DNA methylase [Gemmatimonadetes bacterium]|nr:N-6 DNA methylase [Gemmatimonadota bacterium]
MADATELRAHREWIGYVQPVGIVVSPPALRHAQGHVDRNISGVQERLRACVEDVFLDGNPNAVPAITDLRRLSTEVLGWEPDDLVGEQDSEALPSELEVPLPEYEEVLRPTYAVPDPEPPEDAPPWQILVCVEPTGRDLDRPPGAAGRNWDASPTARLERLLRETQVTAGLLCNGTHLRLLYAPRGETSGHMTFPVSAMVEVSGRPILAGLHMLLRAERLFALPTKQRLLALLSESRRFQAEVSTRLSEQILEGLYELLRGLQAADAHTRGRLLGEVLREEPDQVYEGMLTVLLRLVFTLYAEDRGLLPRDPVFVEHYGIGGLYERLREDAGHHPDTMDQRYGAWARLLALVRLAHDGGGHGDVRLPPRHGYLFNPDRYPFLEGRPWRAHRVMGERIDPPLVSDGVVHRVLEKLLVLDGERLSYRTLDVEEIGSVYETMMGFRLEVAKGRSIAVKPAKSHGAPVAVDLDALLGCKPGERAKWFQDRTDRRPPRAMADRLKNAASTEEVVGALGGWVARGATPNIVAPGAMVLQPSDARRRSGTHYTPRSLTEPIVRTTLRPVLEALGERPTPEQILELRVLDPAMGSGAFLVEACRQLGEAVVRAWHAHDRVPRIPPDEDELMHAMRLVAQRCLYGVDRNPIAADLGKLSLWLATLARDHAFTFIDHAIRHGDSLVGLTRKQIAGFHWAPKAQIEFVAPLIKEKLAEAARLRAEIRQAPDESPGGELRLLLKDADDALADLRMVGDLAVSAFFTEESARKREDARKEFGEELRRWLSDDVGRRELREAVRELREERGVSPFHWEMEFPEVFDRENPGFDAVVGNPPFAGKNTLLASNPDGYVDWLKQVHEESHGNADLVAHFYRRAFNLLREGGCFGLIATNTIAQGDTRSTGLRWICLHGGTIYSAQRRYKWPGQAAVVVSVVHVCRGALPGRYDLDGRYVPTITAYLFHAGGHEDPKKLEANADKSFQGSIVLGMGFTFDDTGTKGVASPISEMYRLIEKDPRNAERIFPYIGGEEVNTSPTHAHHRYVINFEDMTEEEARRWPDLMAIIEQRVRPERAKLGDNADAQRRREHWWLWGRYTPALFREMRRLRRSLGISRVGQQCAFAFLPTNGVFAESVVAFMLESYSAFAALQSRPHEIWARFFGSSMKDDLRYTPSDCFETFPFPEGFEDNPSLEVAGRTYYDFRADLMVRNGEGLTNTYNRFHNPNERSPEIQKLRDLHDAMDRAVLDAYGWTNIQPEREFLLDYEEEEDEEASTRRRKPWRYRWPDEVRDEVLARLLALNEERAKEEQLRGSADDGRKRLERGRPRARGVDVQALSLLERPSREL